MAAPETTPFPVLASRTASAVAARLTARLRCGDHGEEVIGELTHAVTTAARAKPASDGALACLAIPAMEQVPCMPRA